MFKGYPSVGIRSQNKMSSSSGGDGVLKGPAFVPNLLIQLSEYMAKDVVLR